MIEIPSQELVDINSLSVDQKNPNKMEKRQFEALKENLKRFGFIVPIITNKDLLIADGQHRWEAAKDLQMSTVPVIRLSVSEVDRRILRQVLNKLKGDHDKLLDREEYLALLEHDGLADLKTLLGQTNAEYQHLLDTLRPPVQEIDAASVLSIAQLGDVWVLGDHRLVCGDSTKREDVEKLFQGGAADLLFTDPPYGIDYRSRSGSHPDAMEGDENDLSALAELLDSAFGLACAKMREGACAYVWHTDAKMDVKHGFDVHFSKFFTNSATIVWVKNVASMGWQDYRRQHEVCLYGWKGDGHKFYGDRDQTTIWEEDKDAVVNYQHPTQKPVALAARALRNSTLKGQVVYDPFGGSGSTLLACEQLERACRTMEIDPTYASVILERWVKLTGRDPIREKDGKKWSEIKNETNLDISQNTT